MWKFIAVFFGAIFLMHSVSGLSRNISGNGIDSAKVGAIVFTPLTDDKNSDQSIYLPSGGVPYFSTARTYAPSRQILGAMTAKRDMWHNTVNGRQITYTGYYNASCDYVYMIWPNYYIVGSTTIPDLRAAFFDWGNGDWDYGLGAVLVDAPCSYYPQMAVNTKTFEGVAAYHSHTECINEAYSYISVSGACPDGLDTWNEESLPAPPNVEFIQSGSCGDIDAEETPYIWPHHDVDTNFAGEAVIHVASCETDCGDSPDGVIETLTLTYYRKVNPGSWEGAHFIDTVYLPSQLVVADRNSSDVYYCYLKPLWYQSSNRNPCDPDGASVPGYYQLLSDVVCRKSSDDGGSWEAVFYVTDYANGWLEGISDPATFDLSAMVDPNGALHLVWWTYDWFKSYDDDNICGEHSGYYLKGKLWHYDTDNDCISEAFDCSCPNTFYGSGFGAFMNPCTKPNISWCDEKLCMSFMRFGANSEDNISYEYGGSAGYQAADIMLVCSDTAGNMGITWTKGINLTQTDGTGCIQGDCYHEVWPTMAMYSTDSLMIHYLEDKDPGQWYNFGEGQQTNNPVMFMTWPCFSMWEVEDNPCAVPLPDIIEYIKYLSPNGNPYGCTTPAADTIPIEISNCGNKDLAYSANSNASWLTVTTGASGTLYSGTGPRNADDPGWGGKPVCAANVYLEITASSIQLGQGNYTGNIIIDFDNSEADDIEITVEAVVTCDYYEPEYVRISGGSWTVDIFNTPQAGNMSKNNFSGNMKFYNSGEDSAFHPLYKESLIIGWKTGSDIYCYTDYSSDIMGAFLPESLPEYQRLNARFKALSGISIFSVGDPGSGTGYWATEGYWCTSDSMVYGKTEYFIPGSEDTAVLIEKITIWNMSGSTLSDFVAGEGIDWDVDPNNALDFGGIDVTRNMIYQYSSVAGEENLYAGMASYSGHDLYFGGAVLDNPTWIMPFEGYHILDIYNKLTSLDGTYEVFSDHAEDINSVYRFRECSFGSNDTLELCKIKAASLTGLTGLQELIDKGSEFIERYELCGPQQICQGRCGDANNDGVVNVSDAVKTINYVFIGGAPPVPVLACGDANDDGVVNVSDAVNIINYVFLSGTPPGDCHIEAPAGGLPCCHF